MNNIEKLKLDFLTIVIYLISPILAIPTILLSLFKRTRYSIVNYSLLVSYISFCFIPESQWDKVRHIEFYEYVKNMSISEFFIYNFTESPDFIFRFLLYLGGTLGVRVHFVFFIVTFIIIYLILKIYDDFLKEQQIEKKHLWLLIPLFLLSFSYIDIISGFRYALAASFTMYGIYFGLVKKKQFRGIIFIILGIFTHFSVLLFALLYLIYPLISKISILSTKILLLVSFLFVLVPQETFLQIATSLGLGGALETKASIYLNNDNFELASSFAATFIRFFDIVWIYIITFIILLKKQTNNTYYRLLVWSLIATNTFVSFPIIYNRYALFLKFLIVLYFADRLVREQQNKILILFIWLFLVVALNQFIVMRNGYFDILFNSEKWIFWYQIFENKFSSSDIYLMR